MRHVTSASAGRSLTDLPPCPSATDPQSAADHAEKLIEGPWPEAEDVIASLIPYERYVEAETTFREWLTVLKELFPDGTPVPKHRRANIAKSQQAALGRFL